MQRVQFQKARRQQMLADQITQNALGARVPIQQGPVATKFGIGEGLTQLGEAWLGRKAQKEADSMMESAQEGDEARRAQLIAQLTADGSSPAAAGGQAILDPRTGQPQQNQRGQLMANALRGVDPGQADGVLAQQAMSLLNPPEDEAYTLGQGETRFKGGRKVAEVAPKQELTYEQRMALAQAGATNVNVPVSLDKGLYGGLAETQAKQYSDQYSQAQNAPNLLQRAQRVKAALGPDSKAITGAGADWLLTGAKVAAQFGFNTGDAAADTEGLSRDLAASTLDQIKASGLGAGSGFSNADRDFLEKVVGGKITLEGATLRKLADLNERSALATIQKWNATASRLNPEYLKQLGMSPIEMPDGGAPAAAPRLTKNPDGSYNWTP